MRRRAAAALVRGGCDALRPLGRGAPARASVPLVLRWSGRPDSLRDKAWLVQIAHNTKRATLLFKETLHTAVVIESVVC